MRLLGAMESAGRRLRQLHGVFGRSLVNAGDSDFPAFLQIRLLSETAGGKKVTIGDVSKIVKEPNHPELVPRKYLKDHPAQSVLRHLRWIMQKDSLGQDVFLIGPPGPLRREIAMTYLQLTKRELEYVSLSRDTTESDLKQRREIESGTASYIDQCAVRAALEGRVLILEGIEKAERNVLPVLNNLLENREMQLDDGRFLMAANRYDKLLKDHSQEELDALRLVRVSEDFRVIALGLPIPRYQGNPLDPPLRSRFQARDIHPTPFKEIHDELRALAPNVPIERLAHILSFATTLLQSEASPVGLPDFPLDNLPHIIQILNAMPTCTDAELLDRVYPYNTMLGKEGKEAVEQTMNKFEIVPMKKEVNASVSDISLQGGMASLKIKHGSKSHKVQVASGVLDLMGAAPESHFVNTKYHHTVLSQMIQSHLVKDFCIIGPRGCGKSVVVKQFADMLGYHIEPIMLYQDMTSRDLLQQRTTLPNGDTVWRPTPLVTAALEGSLAVLDGVHRVNAGSFSVLHRLVSERELQLFDGTRLVSKDRYESIKEETGLSEKELENRNILPIHPSFRIIALSEPPVVGSPKQQWLSPEMLTMFLYHNMRPLSRTEELDVISRLVPGAPDLNKLFDFVHRLRQSTDATLQSLASSLSTRQLLRIARRLAQFPSEDLHSVIHKACLARFLPRLAQSALNQTLEESQVLPKQASHQDDYQHSVTCEVKDGMVRIGETTVPTYSPKNKSKVPDILFYENPQHLTVMEDMLKDFTLGEHLLLVGNQGVGKNKIVDRFLQLLNRPREYVQLHRDTTVQTLTLQPTVREGVIMYEDSPLVVAVKLGHVLVVDEADKAPTNVTCVLKTLVESGEMHLADGRRIVAADSGIPASPNVIVAHPDFRMLVLANRPGFPFLGNDFFGAMGDIFSCHAIDNPDMESEMAMLRQYGPGVSDVTLTRLVSAFAELREMADQGLISYPYSTREVVNMVRHLQQYPNEGLTTVVKNVFDFDSYNKELQETIVETMQKHGIPVGSSQASISLAKEIPLPKFEHIGRWQIASQGMRKRTSLMSLPVTTSKISVKGPVDMFVQSKTLDRTESRAAVFSEEEAHSILPLEETNIVCDVAVSKMASRSPGQNKHDVIYVATCHPICLYTLTPTSHTTNLIDMFDVFPSTMGSYRPQVRIQALAAPLDDLVLLHEQVTNVLIAANVENGQITRLVCQGLPEIPPAQRRFPTISSKIENPYRMCVTEDTDERGTTVFYKQNGQQVEVVNVLEGISHSVSLPFNIKACQYMGDQKWVLADVDSDSKYVLERKGEEDFSLLPIKTDEGHTSNSIMHMATTQLSDGQLSQVLEEKISSPNRVAVLNETYGSVLLGFPELSDVEVYAAPREPLPQTSIKSEPDPIFGLRSKPPALNKERAMSYLAESGQVVRALPGWQVPSDVKPENVKAADLSGFLEVSDLANHKLRYIPVPGPKHISPYASWLFNNNDCNVFIAPSSNDGLVSVDIGGCVRQWETVPTRLETSLKQWRDMLGYEDSRPLQLNEERESGRDHEDIDPKHGKEDPLNQPHVGGNTWAGGVGGSGTAGLGGFGGPYRLDSGNQVFQVPQWEKDAVPEHVKQAAREIAQKAYLQRLKEIQMSQYDGELYERYSASVRRQVQSLRVILDSLQAKGKERQWIKHQSYGELDDAKLIEGLTGESGIYKRRGEKEPEMGSPQEHPKRLRLIVDVSGSMYRFDGHDSRLTRQMEATLMVMEAFETYEEKFKYDIYGHSGETYLEQFVKVDKPPKDNKERLNVLKMMLAHSQFCISGDNTLEAAKHHIKAIAEEEADEHFIILLSDANFDRYGIRPSRFGEILTANEDVNAYAVFVGSLGDQAVRLSKQLPMGHSYVCLDTKNLPQIMQQIFTSTMLSS